MSNNLNDMTMDFAVNVLAVCDTIKGHYSIINQLERSATSIGANVREGSYAHSKPDFIAKYQIALKECFETEYWLELLSRAGYVEKEKTKGLYHECGSIRRILIASINTAKENS